LHEYFISETLGHLFPDHVPTILTTRPEWHGWLMADAEGEPLNGNSSPADWRLAVQSLGRLQIESTRSLDRLAEAGCRNLRTDVLLDLVDPFIDVMNDLMRKQEKVPPNLVNEKELLALKGVLKDSLQCLASLQIPEALGHGDFNPGNIIVGSERCAFLDWAEAHIAHPFLTFEYLLAHIRKDHPAIAEHETELRSCYSNTWSPIVSRKQIEEAYLFSPLVALFAYAAGGYVWRDSERMTVPGFQAYLRSLTRRMKKEADLLQRRRIECIN
jgi:Phosphotransferase enzyme family